MLRAFFSLLIGVFPLLLFSQENPLTCLEKEKDNFFPYTIVTSALSLNQVNQSVWTPIANTLEQRSREVPAMMRSRGVTITPNPFVYPYNDRIAKEMWLQMLERIFIDTLYENQVYNPAIIGNAFNYIKANHLSQFFPRCFPMVTKEEKEQKEKEREKTNNNR